MQARVKFEQRKRHYGSWDFKRNKEFHYFSQFFQWDVFSPNSKIYVKSLFIQQKKVRY
jgi:hypothetical protein